MTGRALFVGSPGELGAHSGADAEAARTLNAIASLPEETVILAGRSARFRVQGPKSLGAL